MERIKKTVEQVTHRLTHAQAVVGAPPGTLNVSPDARPPSFRVIAYGPDGLAEPEVASVSELKALEGTAPVLWIDVVGVGDARALHELGELFGLHPLALEDVMNVHQRPKVEDYEDHLYAVLRMPASEDASSFEQVSLFLGAGWVITLQETDGDCFTPVRSRLRQGRGRIRSAGGDYLAYALMDTIVDSFFPLVEDLDEHLELLEDRIYDASGRGAAGEIHEARNVLHRLRRILSPTREALGALARIDGVEINPDTRVFLRDCQDHAARLLDAVDASRDLCASLMDLYLSANDHRMNEVMKVLTIIATLFMPLGFIAGLYGMNFDPSRSPWNMPELGWAYGYPFALGLMAATVLGLLVFFWRKGWLSRAR